MIRQLSKFTHGLMALYLKPGMTVIDATLGNGHDATYVLSKIGQAGWLYGYDIQHEAVLETSEKLKSEGFDNYTIYNVSHDRMCEEFSSGSVDLIIYNLGYLPNFDKSITTLLETTSRSIMQAVEIIKRQGVIIITAYRGHEEGLIESDWIDNFASGLDGKSYHVMQAKYANQGFDTPYLTIIEKK